MIRSIIRSIYIPQALTLVLVLSHLGACTTIAQTNPYKTESAQWFTQGQQTAQHIQSQPQQKNKAKNIILFIGDGMSLATVTAARIYAGQQQGMSGEEYELSFEKLPYTALIKTYNTDQQTPDSAGTMTAIMTGVKTRAGLIGVSDEVTRGECNHFKESQLMSALMLAEIQGKATGIVTNTRITHATPAATYAHSADRNFEDDSVNSECGDIAKQLIDFPYGDGIDVALGGGKRHFIPTKEGGKRRQENLIQAWLLQGNSFVEDEQSLLNFKPINKANPKNQNRLLGLFANSHMDYEADRKPSPTGQPSLKQMTLKALDILSQNPKGFFLMVESGRIDHAHHNGNAYRALTETEMFSQTIEAVLSHDTLNPKETLMIVTADHSHVMTMAGYPTRGNPILGKVVTNDQSGMPKKQPELALDQHPYTTLGYINGQGANVRHQHDSDNQRKNGRIHLENVDTEAKDYFQESLIQLKSETHSAEDVGVWAVGPWSHLVRGNLEQNVLFHIMNYGGNLASKP